MTKRQREQVSKLLRCAADCLTRTSKNAWSRAVTNLNASTPVQVHAGDAFFDVLLERAPSIVDATGHLDHEEGRRVYLEAAQRVEEGSWP